MEPQPLLTRRPIVCTRCMHGHAVDEITGRDKTPTEYHCVFCGNYAIVGVPAKWPFMEVVKAESESAVVSTAAWKGLAHYSSPMQVGESLVKPRAPRARQFTKPAQQAVGTEEKPAEKCKPKEEPMFKCKHPDCDKRGAVAGYCNNHFKGLYGITAEQYRAEKNGRKEDPEVVAERVREYSLAASKARVDRARETFHAAMEEEKEKSMPAPPPAPPRPETKPPRNEQETPKPEKKAAAPEQKQAKSETKARAPEPDAKYRMVFIPLQVYEKIVQLAEQEYRPVDLQVQWLLHKGMQG